ncbi:DegT/DnrJ/EryC1/StrS family aminotransferase [Streptacidiphilus sp. ASG 303]|uniref:DegT/DnrJ/EryC1/StrS family aminotransferase n=1 Tax=Streptacidiphilus sp. ASG 303 TaxID=2896847 RepID=UPI001E3301D3|nr:DegT/DnrJ/EryC1/StrS family aminotransferase [Streptacidiphilus sp. ASG 303]MCD0483910.1 DegT/DnrJ/EryC1/StrS family aminotransferase [Streptacidiphilus sp. ASG 303]
MTIPVMVPWLGEEEAEAAAEAVRSGWIAQGPRTAAFERAFADHLGVEHAVAVSSCTTALHLALIGAGVGPGDEVVVPSFSFVATANAVTYVGAVPVFADVDPATGNLTPATVEPLLTARTRAVVAVDQGGVPVDLDALRALLDPRGTTVVEDAACAAGSVYRGAPAGRGAELAAFSFHPRKLLTTGEGGMVTCRDGAVAARLRRLREHGMSVSAADRHAAPGGAALLETYDEIGFNHRMTDIQAAVGLVQLGRLPALVERRRALAGRYRALLAPLLGEDGGRLVADPPHGTTNFQSCWLLLPDAFPVGRDDLLGRLAAAGISARRGIMAAHLEAPYAGTARVPLPATEHLTRNSLVLPLHHFLTEEQQDQVAAALLAAAC